MKQMTANFDHIYVMEVCANLNIFTNILDAFLHTLHQESKSKRKSLFQSINHLSWSWYLAGITSFVDVPKYKL